MVEMEMRIIVVEKFGILMGLSLTEVPMRTHIYGECFSDCFDTFRSVWLDRGNFKKITLLVVILSSPGLLRGGRTPLADTKTVTDRTFSPV